MRYRASARSPQPEVCPQRGRGRGVARCCLALWSSEQVDRHLLPHAALGVTLGCRLFLPTEREPPTHAKGPQGCWRSGVSGLGGWANLDLVPPIVGSQEAPVLRAVPPHTRAGGWGCLGLCPCACLSCICPFLCCVLCVWPSGPPLSAIPTLGEGLLRGAGALCLSLGKWGR